MRQITPENLEDFIRGTALLGTGGGGDPYIGRLMVAQELETCRAIDILDPDELTEDHFGVSLACMGAPTAFVEKLPNASSMIASMERAEKELGRKFNCIVPLEAGGINATIPLVVAARLGLPVVDGDGMGRAFPEFQMTTFNIYGADVNPFVMSDDFRNTVLINTDNAHRTENYGRPVCVQMGGIASCASYPMTGPVIRDTCVPRTISLAIEIGAALRSARSAGEQDVCEALVDYFKTSNPPRFATVLFDGKIQDILRETTAGFAVGKVRLTALDDPDTEMLVTFQNEFSRASIGDQTLAIVPDLITILDRETGEPITTENLGYGQRVKVVAIAAAENMRTPEALKVIGPRCFGIDEDFEALETISWK
ncbi:N-methylhydantoinase (ATP-hydrolyzing) [Candidatus Rhodobacter oscarellae]|uniref:N-methylhydantoinase (ATP-hydrolyzing) n=1 Tax=Candidatus Rhodobacter oscarellae TaxID=1675527 RepID=A0A0J9ECA4_9RHOB|nr:DUF917 domain-containing protein [Candidatus Rhodobacter lobularis]KMW60271.1 N-methylhydantoinase (ATP-hydrolyzing) [Candidatus Rhodobacter lobularis]